MSIYLEQHGQGSPLVMLHGWGFNQTIWHSLIPKLSETYRLYLPDLPGFGRTAMMDWQSFCQELLRVLPSEFAVLGWSMGGLLATELTLAAPKRVGRLINIASSPCFLKQEGWPGIESWVFQQFMDKLLASPKQTLDEFVLLQSRGLFPEGYQPYTPSSCALLQGLEYLLNSDFRADLSAITCPVDYHFGRLDAIVPSSLHSLMPTQFPEFHYEFYPRAAHMPFLSHTEQFVSSVKPLAF